MRHPSRALIPAAAVLVLAATGAAATPAVPVTPVAGITVDGDLADWKDVPVRYLESGPRITAVARDARFLYVYFRFSDLELARRVLRSGAVVWFSPGGAHEAGLGLRYRGTEAARQALREMEGDGSAGAPADRGPGFGGMPPPGGPDGGGARPERAPLGALEVLRGGVVDEVLETGSAPDGPAAACRVSDGSFAYELRLPLGEVSSPVARGGAAVPLAIGFQIGGMTKAEREAMRERFGQGGGRGGPGGGPGGGPPAGGFGGGMGGPGGPPQGGGGRDGRTGGGRSAEPVWLDVELTKAAGAAKP